jgi:hypothetical protein
MCVLKLEEKMTRILTSIVGLLLLATAARADVIPGTEKNVLGWQLAAYDRPAGGFSHCGMYIPYNSGIVMHYTIFANYNWRIGWSHASWNLNNGQSVPITVVVDGGAPYNLTAVAIAKTFAVADLPPTAGIFDLMRKGYQMMVYAQNNKYGFNLNGTYAALTELISCVGRFVQPPGPPAPIVGSAASPPQPSPSTTASLTTEQRLEATTLVANLLSQGDLTGYRILSAKEVQELKIPELANWHVAWRAEDVFGVMKIIPASTAQSASTISTALISDDSRGCGAGKFASGTNPDDKSPGTVRSFTACKTDKLSYEIHYIIVPRDDGGFYLFGTFGRSPSGNQATNNVDHVDGLLRAAVFGVLKH